MKVTARVWHQTFSMRDLKSVVKFHEKTIDVKVRDGYAEAMMKVAIEGNKSFTEEFKKFVDLEGYDAREAVTRAIGKEIVEGSCRITLEFQALPHLVYVMRNIFCGENDCKYGELVAKDSLKPIV